LTSLKARNAGEMRTGEEFGIQALLTSYIVLLTSVSIITKTFNFRISKFNLLLIY
jgi:hypothetical protein